MKKWWRHTETFPFFKPSRLKNTYKWCHRKPHQTFKDCSFYYFNLTAILTKATIFLNNKTTSLQIYYKQQTTRIMSYLCWTWLHKQAYSLQANFYNECWLTHQALNFLDLFKQKKQNILAVQFSLELIRFNLLRIHCFSFYNISG